MVWEGQMTLLSQALHTGLFTTSLQCQDAVATGLSVPKMCRITGQILYNNQSREMISYTKTSWCNMRKNVAESSSK